MIQVDRSGGGSCHYEQLPRHELTSHPFYKGKIGRPSLNPWQDGRPRPSDEEGSEETPQNQLVPISWLTLTACPAVSVTVSVTVYGPGAALG